MALSEDESYLIIGTSATQIYKVRASDGVYQKAINSTLFTELVKHVFLKNNVCLCINA